MTRHFCLLIITLIVIFIASVKGAFEPLGPSELLVKSRFLESAVISWEHPRDSIYTGFWLKIHSPDSNELKVMNIDADYKTVTIQNLKPNTKYQLELYTMLDNIRSCNFSSANFETLPAPKEILVTEITENSLELRYNTSFLSDNIPNRRYEFILFPGRESNNTSVVSFDSFASFHNLTPNTFYLVSVQIYNTQISANKEIEPDKIVTEVFKTLPPTPLQDGKHLPHFAAPVSLHVKWKSPSHEHKNFDSYRVVVYWHHHDDYPHEAEKIILPPHFHQHDFNVIPFGRNFTVEIRTIAGDQLSKALIMKNKESFD